MEIRAVEINTTADHTRLNNSYRDISDATTDTTNIKNAENLRIKSKETLISH